MPIKIKFKGNSTKYVHVKIGLKCCTSHFSFSSYIFKTFSSFESQETDKEKTVHKILRNLQDNICLEIKRTTLNSEQQCTFNNNDKTLIARALHALYKVYWLEHPCLWRFVDITIIANEYFSKEWLFDVIFSSCVNKLIAPWVLRREWRRLTCCIICPTSFKAFRRQNTNITIAVVICIPSIWKQHCWNINYEKLWPDVQHQLVWLHQS